MTAKTDVKDINITFVDLETTGLDPECDEIIELAAVRTTIRDNEMIVHPSVCARVMPTVEVSPRVAQINHFDREVWLNSPNLMNLTEALTLVFNEMSGSYHAGSNPRFDEAFMKNTHLVQLGVIEYPRLAHYHLIDVPTLAMSIFLQGKISKLTQASVADFYYMSPPEHSALSDIEQCMTIFAKMYDLTIVNQFSQRVNCLRCDSRSRLNGQRFCNACGAELPIVQQ